MYLPCVGSNDRLLLCEEILADSWAWCERFPDCNYILAGEFNAQLSHSDPVKNYINTFITQHDLRRCDSLFNKHKHDVITYDNIALRHTSVRH